MKFVNREEFEKEYPLLGLKVSECKDENEPKLISSDTTIHGFRSEDDTHEHRATVTSLLYKCNCEHEHISQQKIIKRCECGWTLFHTVGDIDE